MTGKETEFDNTKGPAKVSRMANSKTPGHTRADFAERIQREGNLRCMEDPASE